MTPNGERLTVFFDANALFSPLATNLVLELAVQDVFRPRWSAAVIKECVTAILSKRPDIDPVALTRRFTYMDSAFPDANVVIREQLPAAGLPDAGDEHVLAAAILSGADVLVTNNVKDFPAKALTPFKLQVQTLDAFLAHALDIDRHATRISIHNVLLRLQRPSPWDVNVLALELEARSLLGAAAVLRQICQ